MMFTGSVVPIALGIGPHLIVFLAAATATVTGYGFVVLSAPLLALLLPAPQVVPLTLGLGWVLISGLLLRRDVHRAVDVGLTLRLSSAGLLGIPFGVALLDTLDASSLRLALGVGVTASALLSLLRPAAALRAISFEALSGADRAALPATPEVSSAGPNRDPQWLRDRVLIYAAGLLAGVLSGCVGLNGPPVALYLVWRGVPKDRFRATAAAVVWLLSTATLLIFFVSDRLPLAMASGAIQFTPALAVGWLAGSLLFQVLSVPLFQQLSLAFAAAAGVVTAASNASR